MSIGKFAEHYAKLMNPVHRRKREPYTFLLSGDSDEGRFFDHLSVNTAQAFAIIVAPYKIKLWIATADGTAPFHPLPIVPRTTFAFLEMPVAIFQSTRPVENIFSEIENYVDRLVMSVNDPGVLQIKFAVLEAPAMAEPPISVGMAVPMGVPQGGKKEDERLNRVFEMINSRPSPEQEVKKQRITPSPEEVYEVRPQRPTWEPPVYSVPQPPPPPPIDNRWSHPPQPDTRSNYNYSGRPTHGSIYERPTAPPSSAMSHMVIGAPSTGPNMDQLPAPKRGACRFFNSMQGCTSGSRCKFAHSCAVCGSEQHPAMHHEEHRGGYSSYPRH